MSFASPLLVPQSASAILPPDLSRLVRRVQTSTKERTAEAALTLAVACEQLAAELARREARDHDHHHMATVVQTAEVAIVSKDLKGIIRSWNPGAERLFGHRAEEVVGQSVTVLMPDGEHHEEVHILEKLRFGQHIQNYETLRKHKDGRLVPVSLSISPVRDDTGKIVGAAKIARDMSNRREMQVKSELIGQLQSALSENKTLRGFIPICAHCKKIRDDHGFWQGLEVYLSRQTTARFSHGVCPVCLDKHYSELMSSGL